MTVPTVTVSGPLLDSEGNAASGTITWRCNKERTYAGQTIGRTTETTVVAADGTFTQELVATEGVGISPSGGVWYTVTVHQSGVRRDRRFKVELPATSPTVSFADLVPIDGDETSAWGSFADYVRANASDMQTIGDGTDPNAVTSSNVALLVSKRFEDPTEVILQHRVGYAFFLGTPGVSAGTLQGASDESHVYASTSNITSAVLGFEGIGSVDSPNGKSFGTVIGNQGTAFAQNNVNVTNLIAMRASAPHGSTLTGTVTNAMSFDAQEPTVGTNRYSVKSTGRARFKKGTHANCFELSNASDLLQWSSDGSTLKGYASDGASVRLTLDPGDGATRITSALFGSGSHLICTDSSSEVFKITAAGVPKWSATGNQQTTVGAAGAASALPATPTKYLKVFDSAGTALVVPAYTAS